MFLSTSTASQWVAVLGLGLGAAQATERVSIDSAGIEANEISDRKDVSADGRFVAFRSLASNLVANDTNGFDDVFVHDRDTGTTERVSVDSAGNEADGPLDGGVSISGDGRYVAFASFATNLVAGDTNGTTDVFVHDRLLGVTERVSLDVNGMQGNSASTSPSISAEGRYVAFASAALLVPGDDPTTDIYVRDRISATTERVSVGPGGVAADNSSQMPVISSDGNVVAFVSSASNLIVGDTPFTFDVFVHDRTAMTTERVSENDMGDGGTFTSQDPAISGDGRYVAFVSFSDNLVAGDVNNRTDIFVRDRTLGTTELASLSSSGAQAINDSNKPSISDDGRLVAFHSLASNLTDSSIPGTNIYVRDRVAGTTLWISQDVDGQLANGDSQTPVLAGTARVVVFESFASDLVAGDTNGRLDVFAAAVPLTATLEPIPTPALVADDRFGDAVAAHGNRIAVGRPGANGGEGEVLIYRLEGGMPVLEATISVPVDRSAAAFGAALALQGNQIVIGAPGAPAAGAKGLTSLQAAIFELLSGDWKLKTELTGGTSTNQFGASVAIDGNLVLVGAPGDGSQGAAFAYGLTASGVVDQARKLDAPSGVMDFGRSVATSNGKLAIGAPGPVGGALVGAVQILDQVSGNLADLASRGTLMGTEASSEFGAAVALNGTTLLVGAPGQSSGGSQRGGAFVFDPSSLVQRGQLSPSAPQDGAQFGRSVALAPERLAVGAPGQNGSGAAFEYDRALAQRLLQGAPPGQVGFGSSVAVTETALVIGAPETAGDTGAAFVRADPDRLFIATFE